MCSATGYYIFIQHPVIDAQASPEHLHSQATSDPIHLKKRTWLDEAVPTDVFHDDQSERLWDTCREEYPENQFAEWEKRKGQVHATDR